MQITMGKQARGRQGRGPSRRAKLRPLAGATTSMGTDTAASIAVCTQPQPIDAAHLAHRMRVWASMFDHRAREGHVVFGMARLDLHEVAGAFLLASGHAPDLVDERRTLITAPLLAERILARSRRMWGLGLRSHADALAIIARFSSLLLDAGLDSVEG